MGTVSPSQLGRASEIVDGLQQQGQAAAQRGDSFDRTERTVRGLTIQIGKHALELFIRLQGDGDLGEQVTTDEGESLRRSQTPVSTTVRSIVGTHRFNQFTYAPGAKKAVCLRPINARMSLPLQQWSCLLQEWSQMMAVDFAYEQAMQNLGKILGSNF